MTRYKLNGILLIAFALCSFVVQAQDEIVRAPYYYSINNKPSHEVIEITDYVLSLEYNDQIGQWKNIGLNIYNWKHENVATIALAKTAGTNYYNLKLTDFYGAWVIGDIYACELKDESGKVYKFTFRPVSLPKTLPPDVAVLINPIQLLCDGLSANNVEFVADINGGKAPFRLQWVVMNDTRSALLYQPLEDILKTAGRTSAISVSKSPDYYVLLEVKDACDNVVRKQVHLVCDQQQKKINSIFVEPMVVYPSSIK